MEEDAVTHLQDGRTIKFLNVPGQQFLLDLMILALPMVIIPFLALIVLLVVFPETFSTFYNVPGSPPGSRRQSRGAVSVLKEIWDEPVIEPILRAVQGGLSFVSGIGNK